MQRNSCGLCQIGTWPVLSERKPDLVIGGINHGDNASVNTHYSGTMGVTMEGCMKYIPSVAFSLVIIVMMLTFLRCAILSDLLCNGCLMRASPRASAWMSISSWKRVQRSSDLQDGLWYMGSWMCEDASSTWYDYFGWWVNIPMMNLMPMIPDNWASIMVEVAITPTQVDVTSTRCWSKWRRLGSSEILVLTNHEILPDSGEASGDLHASHLMAFVEEYRRRSLISAFSVATWWRLSVELCQALQGTCLYGFRSCADASLTRYSRTWRCASVIS